MACPARFDIPLDASRDAIFHIASTPQSVRAALRDILNHPILAQLNDDIRGSVELVLAEALNNVVEHAYGCEDGQISLSFQRLTGHLLCCVSDSGAPMPNGDLPKGLMQPIGQVQEMAEGGFGWFLIRELTEDLIYRRIDARNHLSFQFNIEQ